MYAIVGRIHTKRKFNALKLVFIHKIAVHTFWKSESTKDDVRGYKGFMWGKSPPTRLFFM